LVPCSGSNNEEAVFADDSPQCDNTCAGFTCDDWCEAGYECGSLENDYGCQCGGCSHCQCPASCFGYTCNDWVVNGYTCEELEQDYGCYCNACPLCATRNQHTDSDISDSSGSSSGSSSESSSESSSDASSSEGSSNPGSSHSTSVSSSEAGSSSGSSSSSVTSTTSVNSTAVSFGTSILEHCASDGCFGYSCEDLLEANYGCTELLEVYTCDCTRCPQCQTEAPTPAPTPAAGDETEDSSIVIGECPMTCYGYSCNDYRAVDGGASYTCQTLNQTYGCDCNGCDLCEPAKCPNPEGYQNGMCNPENDNVECDFDGGDCTVHPTSAPTPFTSCPATNEGETCDYWHRLDPAYTCEILRGDYGFECDGCDVCQNADAASAVAPQTCLTNCYDYSCDVLVNDYEFTCETLTGTYGCDCTGCTVCQDTETAATGSPSSHPTESPTIVPSVSPTPSPTPGHPCETGEHDCDVENGQCVREEGDDAEDQHVRTVRVSAGEHTHAYHCLCNTDYEFAHPSDLENNTCVTRPPTNAPTQAPTLSPTKEPTKSPTLPHPCPFGSSTDPTLGQTHDCSTNGVCLPGPLVRLKSKVM